MSLSTEQIEQFETDGFVIVRGAFRRELARKIEGELERMLIDRNEAEVLLADERCAYLRPQRDPPYIELTNPTFLECMDALIGENDYASPQEHGAFVAALPTRPAKKSLPPSYYGRWHVDSLDDFLSLVDHRAVVPVFLLSPCDPNGGGTRMIRGSHIEMAKFLATYGPVKKNVVDAFCDIFAIGKDDRIAEFSGSPGDLAIMHRLCVHSAAPNWGTSTRWICNTGVPRKRAYPVEEILRSTHPIDRSIAPAIRASARSNRLKKVAISRLLRFGALARRGLGKTRQFPRHQEPPVEGLRSDLYSRLTDACRWLVPPSRK